MTTADPLDPNNAWVYLNALADCLRNDYRIKQAVDYALTYKYGKVHILCAEVYRETIAESCATMNIEVTTFHTY